MPFYPDELWTTSLTSKLSSLVISPKQTEDVHALTVLARIAKDPELSPESVGMPYSTAQLGPQPGLAFFKVIDVAAGKLGEYADAWIKTLVPDRAVLRRKFEELAWMVSVIYGIGGWAGREKGGDEKGEFNGDFFKYAPYFFRELTVTHIYATACISSPRAS